MSLKRIGISKKIFIVLISLFVLDILSVLIYWNASTSYSNVSTDNTYDCGIVFFHSVTKQGALSTDTKERCNLAIELYKKGSIKNILCVGGASLNKAGSLMMKDYLSYSGIPDSSLTADTLSFSSITNLSEADKILTRRNFRTALIISSPSHIPRLKYLSERLLHNINKSYITFNYDYGIIDIYLDCNSEFIKWVYLLFLPESFTVFSKKFLLK
jgi:vancomycin permeability regulator SanA